MVCPLLVAGLKSFLQQRVPAIRWLACASLVAVFAWSLSFFYVPGQGFTYLISFGDKHHSRFVPELKAASHVELQDSEGYDAQYYAQIAMHPHLGDPVLAKSVDGILYRARRILGPGLAWVLGGGNPVRALHIFAVENLASWLLLALLLFRWFPPLSWDRVARWGAVLFSFGLIFSVVRALPDGPSLLLLASGMALLEAGRPWLGSWVLGVGGLGKDTSVLGASGLALPGSRSPRDWARWLAQAAMVVLPLALWMGVLRLWLGRGDDIGGRNFSAPFCGLAVKLLQSVVTFVSDPRGPAERLDLVVMVGLVTQFGFFVLWRRWSDPWWRVGASYAFLMVFLGDAVWEGYPSAGARVLLPMTLAFNILVPKGRRWLALLVIGNLGVLGSVDLLKPPGRESCVIKGPTELRVNPRDGSQVQAIFGLQNWWRPERSRWEYWRWSLGEATVTVRNPQPFPITASLRFRLRSEDRRQAIVARAGAVLWQGSLEPDAVTKVALDGIVLPPGDTVFVFRSDRPGAPVPDRDTRKLSFSLRELVIELTGRP